MAPVTLAAAGLSDRQLEISVFVGGLGRGLGTESGFAVAGSRAGPLAVGGPGGGIAAALPHVAVQLLARAAVFETGGIGGAHAGWPRLASLAVVSVATFRSGLRAP